MSPQLCLFIAAALSWALFFPAIAAVRGREFHPLPTALARIHLYALLGYVGMVLWFHTFW